MRDDIHKRVPRPPKLRQWVRRALREADRLAGRTLDALDDALHEACKAEISPGFVRGLQRYMSSEESDLFGVLGGIMSPRELGGEGSPMERSILADCQRAVAAGLNLQDALLEGIADALRERSRADIRAAEPVLLPTRDPEAYRAINQMKADVEHLDFRAVAAKQLGLLDRERRIAPRLSPEENLLTTPGHRR
jgi:hypothetical protein